MSGQLPIADAQGPAAAAADPGATPVPVRYSLDSHAFAAPAYQTAHAAGLDVYAAVTEPLSIPPGAVVAVPTGVRLEIPPGYEAQVRPRSGLALRHSIGIPNGPGTIDAD